VDKAANNVIFICKKWYIDQVVKELHVYDNTNDDTAYEMVLNEQSDLCDELKLPKMGNTNTDKALPTFYGLPKMHNIVPKL